MHNNLFDKTLRGFQGFRDTIAGGDPESDSGDSGSSATGTADNPFAGTPFDGLDPEYHGNESFGEGRDLNSLAKEFVNLQSKIGANPIVKPKPDADADTWNKYYEQLGRPAEVGAYEYDHDEYAEGFNVPEAELEAWKQDAYDSGLTQQQFAAVTRKYLGRMNESYKAGSKAAEDQAASDIQSLKNEWDQAYDQNVRMVQDFVNEFGTEGEGDNQTNPFKDFMNANPQFGNNPIIVKFMHKASQAMLDSELMNQGRPSGGLLMSPADAQAAYNQKLTDPEFTKALIDAMHPGHAAAVEEKTRLMKIIHRS